MAVEFIGNTDVRHVYVEGIPDYDAVFEAVDGASPSKVTVADRLAATSDAQAMMDCIDNLFKEGKAVALLCEGPAGETAENPEGWKLLTGTYLLDGEPSGLIHTIDPRYEEPTQLGRPAIKNAVAAASRVTAFALYAQVA